MSVRILTGDCRELMANLEPDSLDSAVTDPPYHLTSIVKRFGKSAQSHLEVASHKDHSTVKAPQYKRLSRGFMGQQWDGGDVAFDPETWAAVLRVLKPGAHLVAFSGTRTYHRMVCAIEDAGFEIRDQLAWVYGAGFPKSHNMDHRRGKEFCGCDDRTETLSERDLRLVRDADVSPPINASAQRGQVLFESLPEQGSPRSMLRAEPEEGSADGAELLLEGRHHAQASEGELQRRPLCEGAGMGDPDGAEGSLHHGASLGDGPNVRLPSDANGGGQPQGSQSGEQRTEQPGIVADERGPQTWRGWPLCERCGKPDIPRGLGTALKPAWEPICLARKPLIGTVAGNVLQHGTGAINIDGCRVGDEVLPEIRAGQAKLGTFERTDMVTAERVGRWPANIIHDGSDEVLAHFPSVKSGALTPEQQANGGWAGTVNCYGTAERGGTGSYEANEGSAARFFYCAKATTAERSEGNNHPTVKPVDLMRWLCRLVTPKGGTVLDPFAGSGSTLIAADAEQFNAIGCELSPDYAAIAERRVRDAAGMFAEVQAA